MWNYETTLTWQQGEVGKSTSAGKPDLHITAPPEFGGRRGLWTPEDLLVSAVESCLLLTTLYFVEKMAIGLLDYQSRATGHLERTRDGLRFTSMDVHIDADVTTSADEVKMQEAVAEAEKRCPVGSALNCPIHVTVTCHQAHAAQA